MRSLDFIEQETLRRDLPPFRVGDAVRVHARVKEGEKERIQVFEGVVIRRRGAGASETFTVRKIASGVGVERVFPVQSLLIDKVEIKNRGYVRQSRLYYLRELTGKKARLKSKVRDLSDLLSPEAEDNAANAASATDEQLSEPVAAPVETTEDTGSKKKLKGKARKKAAADDKKVRMAEQQKEDAARAAKKAEEEAKAEAKAAADAAAAESEGGEGDASEEPAE